MHVAPGFAVFVFEQRAHLQQLLQGVVAAQLLVAVASRQDRVVLAPQGGHEVLAQVGDGALGVAILDPACAAGVGVHRSALHQADQDAHHAAAGEDDPVARFRRDQRRVHAPGEGVFQHAPAMFVRRAVAPEQR